jgi:uncharacterized membrane-anchored protein
MLPSHPLREALHNEVHARPYERLKAPLALSHVALFAAPPLAAAAHITELLRTRDLPLPATDANHLSADLGGVHLRWEKHTEFHTCTFWKPLANPPDKAPDSFKASAIDELPPDWLARLPGQWLVGLHVLVLEAPGLKSAPLTVMPALRAFVSAQLQDDSLVGACIMDGDAQVFTDFRLRADGFARLVLAHDGMNPRRLGRAVQRLLEIETYRMAALLGLPMAREVGASLAHAEEDLAQIAAQIRSAQRHEEPELLRRLTQLAAEVESLYARTHARFSASAAYFELMQRRINELREQRLEALQTLGDFMDRRLAPAMQTCAWAARRQQALSERISRISNLLRTRVEIEQQQSSQDLLDAMNRRQKAQMLLQTAVEGLSVAAVTYYGAGLVGYLAKGAKTAGVNVVPDVAVAISIPLIAVAVWLGIRRLHRSAQAAAD